MFFYKLLPVFYFFLRAIATLPYLRYDHSPEPYGEKDLQMIKLTYTKILPLVAAAACLAVAACEKKTESTTTTETTTEMAPPADTGTAMSDMGMSETTTMTSTSTSM
ncbi:hypothetical protein ABAC402_01080 [Asticcacaulis sp. AC402]|nr:hypothetical protein ABAC402_01080 [Asticcacaulis sp. AC402]